MELKDTVDLMLTTDYKDRFKAEYWQTKIRYDKLHKKLIELGIGTLDFTPTYPMFVLLCQEQSMAKYLRDLKLRAQIEGIDINE